MIELKEYECIQKKRLERLWNSYIKDTDIYIEQIKNKDFDFGIIGFYFVEEYDEKDAIFFDLCKTELIARCFFFCLRASLFLLYCENNEYAKLLNWDETTFEEEIKDMLSKKYPDYILNLWYTSDTKWCEIRIYNSSLGKEFFSFWKWYHILDCGNPKCNPKNGFYETKQRMK